MVDMNVQLGPCSPRAFNELEAAWSAPCIGPPAVPS